MWEKVIMMVNKLNPFYVFTATKCGHRTKKKGCVSAFGFVVATEMPLNKNGSVDYCLECIEKMATQCAWCNGPIFIGDPITLYIRDSDFKIPDHAVVYSRSPLQLVGCLRCADTTADRVGTWLPNKDGVGHVSELEPIYRTFNM